MALFGNRNGLAEALAIIGASLKDASPDSDGGNLAATQKMFETRRASGADLAQRQGLQARGRTLAGGDLRYQGMPAGLPQVGEPAPQLFARSAPTPITDPKWGEFFADADEAGYKTDALRDYLKMSKPETPKVIEGPNGIYRQQPGGDGFDLVTAYPQAVPFGWEVGPDGNLKPKAGGPNDPAYIAQTSGVRRQAVVDRPLPQKGRSGGGSARPRSYTSNDVDWH